MSYSNINFNWSKIELDSPLPQQACFPLSSKSQYFCCWTKNLVVTLTLFLHPISHSSAIPVDFIWKYSLHQLLLTPTPPNHLLLRLFQQTLKLVSKIPHSWPMVCLLFTGWHVPFKTQAISCLCNSFHLVQNQVPRPYHGLQGSIPPSSTALLWAHPASFLTSPRTH